jgi:hypothetical protein
VGHPEEPLRRKAREGRFWKAEGLTYSLAVMTYVQTLQHSLPACKTFFQGWQIDLACEKCDEVLCCLLG